MISISVLDLVRYIIWCLIFAFIFICNFIFICLLILDIIGILDCISMVVSGWILFFVANTIEGRN